MEIYSTVAPGYIATDSEVRRDYFEWLARFVHPWSVFDSSYWCVVQHLHSVPFTWLYPRDEDRSEDGIALRRTYELETGIPIESYLEASATMLEVMIGIAFRMDDILWDGGVEGERVPKAFWMMVVSLGLDEWDDDIYETGVDDIDAKIFRLLSRTYEKDGRGGLFPLLFPKRDQRRVEIYYQMQDYIQEGHVW